MTLFIAAGLLSWAVFFEWEHRWSVYAGFVLGANSAWLAGYWIVTKATGLDVLGLVWSWIIA